MAPTFGASTGVCGHAQQPAIAAAYTDTRMTRRRMHMHGPRRRCRTVDPVERAAGRIECASASSPPLATRCASSAAACPRAAAGCLAGCVGDAGAGMSRRVSARSRHARAPALREGRSAEGGAGSALRTAVCEQRLRRSARRAGGRPCGGHALRLLDISAGWQVRRGCSVRTARNSRASRSSSKGRVLKGGNSRGRGTPASPPLSSAGGAGGWLCWCWVPSHHLDRPHVAAHLASPPAEGARPRS